MSRRPGSPNKSKRAFSQPLGAKWTYDGRVVTDAGRSDLHILKVYGAPIEPHLAELDEAIKAECVRLNATVHLDDQLASALMFSRLAQAASVERKP